MESVQRKQLIVCRFGVVVAGCRGVFSLKPMREAEIIRFDGPWRQQFDDRFGPRAQRAHRRAAHREHLYKASGAVRFGVGTTAREGGFVGLNVRDKTGAIRSRVFASDDGKQTGFQVQDPGPKLRVEMGLSDVDHRAGVQIRDATGVSVWQAP